MKKTDFAYVAGIIDGEGSISIYRMLSRSSKRRMRYSLLVTVTNTNEWLIQWLKMSFGGSICKVIPRQTNWKPQYRWSLSTRQAADFLKLIKPYLHLKRPEAEIAIAFQSRMKQGAGLSDEAAVLQEADAILIRKYHAKGKKVT
ncbi:MAG: LAGLIDADG family homing endonuclease [Dehalococcoidales bacterium]|nr:LAGLIDADG family homing endonuclease [Dehalococcoidales bacterium]